MHDATQAGLKINTNGAQISRFNWIQLEKLTFTYAPLNSIFERKWHRSPPYLFAHCERMEWNGRLQSQKRLATNKKWKKKYKRKNGPLKRFYDPVACFVQSCWPAAVRILMNQTRVDRCRVFWLVKPLSLRNANNAMRIVLNLRSFWSWWDGNSIGGLYFIIILES